MNLEIYWNTEIAVHFLGCVDLATQLFCTPTLWKQVTSSSASDIFIKKQQVVNAGSYVIIWFFWLKHVRSDLRSRTRDEDARRGRWIRHLSEPYLRFNINISPFFFKDKPFISHQLNTLCKQHVVDSTSASSSPPGDDIRFICADRRSTHAEPSPTTNYLSLTGLSPEISLQI